MLRPPPELSAHQYVILLLHIAAKIEQALMVEYLYAAYSLVGPQVPAECQPKVAQWQEVILLGIAKEEMGRLMTVQNIPRCLGGPLNLDREDYPWDSELTPFPFRLEPLTLPALGRFIFAESPIDFQMEVLIDVNEADRSIVVSGGPDSRERHLFRFSLDSKAEPKRLTREPGRHNGVFGDNKESFLHRFDLLDGRAGWEVLQSADAKQIAAFPSVAERSSSLPKVELLRTEGPRALDAAIVRPRDFKRGGRYPVILDVHAGPGHKQVLAQPDRYMIDQWVADRGYILVALDRRGTPGRGRDWERAIRGNLIDIPLADLIAGPGGDPPSASRPGRGARGGPGDDARGGNRLRLGQ